MSREAHVRFSEGAGARFPRATRPSESLCYGREARNGIGLWMNFYNHHRPHQAMNNQFPMAAWRAGTDRIEAAKTVDMQLRLDNANALPTYQQQTQTQQQEAA